ncbi:MAG: hypothetical protein WDZ91_08205 [Paenibacillaceae bacterium]
MNHMPKNITILLEANEMLNKEFLVAQQELKAIELNNLIMNMEIGMNDKEHIIRYLERYG